MAAQSLVHAIRLHVTRGAQHPEDIFPFHVHPDHFAEMYYRTPSDLKPQLIEICIACTSYPPFPAVYQLIALVVQDEDSSYELVHTSLIHLLRHLHYITQEAMVSGTNN